MRLLFGMLVAGLAIGASAPARAQITGDIVKIGVLTDMSGIVSDATGEGSVVAAQLAAEEFGNRVAGKPVQIVFADHQLKPDVAANIARKWFEQDGVDAIADVPNSAVALAVQEVARTRSRVMLFSSPGTTALTNQFCSPTSVAWTFDTYALARGTAKTVVEGGGKIWYFVTADYAFGHQLQKDASAVVQANGGKVLGASAHPQGTTDFASFLLQAQASKANIVGLANAAGDTVATIKQAEEFGLTAGGQKMAAMLLLLTDVHSLGLQATQGTFLTTPFYWDLNTQTRAWSEKFAARRKGQRPTFMQIGVYEAVRHYLQAIEAAGSDDANKVIEKMRATPIESAFTHGATIREDGRVVRDMYLAEVKAPKDSKGEWDLYKILRTIPAQDVTIPLAESTCPLVKR
ncbi:amino acid/amide ABC transporter substrate-binding protein, HAAT family (TC 3.A.1.4.-) [Bradyrhizobium shewense]|uniref:Amino acid/amide ABC transporter substrate-binding protein, HAAT family (TC 3.A.1.4.-) n=1 Tax=Bradyrhizobium shewense TaxID=1761772 RepID=A0A1C3X0P4_9BRAD|nr:ABC transporter substrate-binding protein [Bradyrhizobium shewense]SCB45799.1 amino acid/amide ABC transporter substrate-binding protein, HAAT family (TC 3.A.1.4.-) [Bradyrhizobium shewense]